MRVPDEVVAALSTPPAVGTRAPFAPLLTVDDEGYPHTCLLCTAELSADPDGVCAVVAGARTSANLRRTGRAALLVVLPTAAVHLTLRAEVLAPDGDWLAAGFALVSAVHDRVPTRLEPPRFAVTAEIAAHEDWPRCARLLREVRRSLATGRAPTTPAPSDPRDRRDETA